MKFIYIHENMHNQNHCMSIKQVRLTVTDLKLSLKDKSKVRGDF